MLDTKSRSEYINLFVKFVKLSSNSIRNTITGKIKWTLVEFSQISPVLHEKIKKSDSINLSCSEFQYLHLVKNSIRIGNTKTEKPIKVVTNGANSKSTKVAKSAATLEKKT